MPDNPTPKEQVCFNCCHLRWMVGIGQGVKCSHERNRLPDDSSMPIPHRRHSCKYFDRQEGAKQDTGEDR